MHISSPSYFFKGFLENLQENYAKRMDSPYTPFPQPSFLPPLTYMHIPVINNLH